jgi:hypothetical protein
MLELCLLATWSVILIAGTTEWVGTAAGSPIPTCATYSGSGSHARQRCCLCLDAAASLKHSRAHGHPA